MSSERSQHGFTIAELVTVIAIVAILSAIALPLVRFGLRRQSEIELRERLERLTWAIDRYEELRGRNLIKVPPALAQGMYPKDLEELTKPIELLDGKKLRLLSERDIIDPMTGRKEWRTVSSFDDPDSTSTDGRNVWDVHSTSTRLALDGKTHYNEW